MSLFSKKQQKQIYFDGKQTTSQQQSKIIVRALIYCAIGFLIIAGLSFGFSILWQAIFTNGLHDTVNIIIVICVTIGLLLLSSILAGIWQLKMIFKASPIFTCIVWGIFIISTSLAFSSIIAPWSKSYWWIVGAVFGMGAVIFGVLGLIGWGLSRKSILTINKMMLIGGLILAIASIVLIILGVCGTLSSNDSPIFYVQTVIFYFIAGGFLLLSFVSTLSTFASIKYMQQFAQLRGKENDKQIMNRLSILYGYKLLVNFIGIIWWMLNLIFMTAKVK